MKFKPFALVLVLVLGGTAFGGRLETLSSGTPNDFYAVAHHPAADYYLLAGDGTYRYDSTGLTQLNELGRFYAAAWRPQGDYALLAGEDGQVYRYNGTTFTPIGTGTAASLTDLAFSPSGDHAVIVGYGGTVLIFDGSGILDYSIGGPRSLEGVTWKPDGSKALIVGIYDYATEEVLSWDRTSVSVEWSGLAVVPGGIAYHPAGDYALIIEDWGHVAKYSDAGYLDLYTGFWQETDGLNSISWSPDGSTALITGAWAHGPFPGKKTLIEFDGQRFNVLRMFQDSPKIYENAAWNAAGSEALVVGRQGELAIYYSEPHLVGSIYCEADNYVSGETLKVCVDVINESGNLPVDIYIDRCVDFATRRWWPGWGFAPAPKTLVLPAGHSVMGYTVFNKVLPPVPYQMYVNWELWIRHAGSTGLNELYCYSSDMIVIDP